MRWGDLRGHRGALWTPAEPEELDGYAVLYDEAAGGVTLDSRLEGDTLSLDLYPLSNGTTEWSAAPLREF